MTKLATQITLPGKFCVQCKPQPKFSLSVRNVSARKNLPSNRQALLSAFSLSEFQTLLCCNFRRYSHRCQNFNTSYVVLHFITLIITVSMLCHMLEFYPDRPRASLVEVQLYNQVLVISSFHHQLNNKIRLTPRVTDLLLFNNTATIFIHEWNAKWRNEWFLYDVTKSITHEWNAKWSNEWFPYDVTKSISFLTNAHEKSSCK